MADIQLFLHMIKDSSVYAKPNLGQVNPYYVGLNAFNQPVTTNASNVQISVPNFQPSQAGGPQTGTAGPSTQTQFVTIKSEHGAVAGAITQGPGQEDDGTANLPHTIPLTELPPLTPDDQYVADGLKERFGAAAVDKAVADARAGDKDAFLKLIKFRRETILMKAKKKETKDQSRWKTRYTCEEPGCGHVVINNIQHFRRHVVKDHLNGLKVFGCILCNKAFFTKYDLDIHYQRHVNGTEGSSTRGSKNGSANGGTQSQQQQQQQQHTSQAGTDHLASVQTAPTALTINPNLLTIQQPGNPGGQPVIAIPVFTDHNQQQLAIANAQGQTIPQYGIIQQGPNGQQHIQMFQTVPTAQGQTLVQSGHNQVILAAPANTMQQQQHGIQMNASTSGTQIQTTANATNMIMSSGPPPSGGGGGGGGKKKKKSHLNQDDIIWALKLKYGALDIDNAISAARSSDESVFMKFIAFKRTQLISDKIKDGKPVQKTLYTCEEANCGHRVVNNIHHFRRHIIRDHLSGLKLFSCEFCTKTFHTKYDLGRHYIRHAKTGKQFPQLQEKIQSMIKRQHN